MKSLEKKSSFSLIFRGDTIFPPFLSSFLRGILSAPSRLPFPQDCHQWRASLDHLGGGVKNIMREGGPAKINGTFSSHVFSLLSFQLQYGLTTHSRLHLPCILSIQEEELFLHVGQI